jgi:sortase A
VGGRVGPVIRKVVRGTGKTLIAAGLLILLFVAYQLWGTGLAESRSQKALATQFTGVTTPPTTTGAIETPVVVEPPPLGGSLGKIVIPKAGVDKYLVEGVGVEDLKKAPGHYPGTPMPGEPGNVAIAGHRTTYGAPFFDLDKLEIGDPIEVTTAAGAFRYEVMESKVVAPDASEVLDDTDDNRLTLTTCNPKYSAAQRLVVVAKLSSEPIQPPPVVEGSTPPTTAAPPSLAGEELAGLSGRRAARGPAFAWGILAAAVALATWYLSHMWRRRWLAYVVGAPVFLAVLFVFFENFARLLPSNI